MGRTYSSQMNDSQFDSAVILIKHTVPIFGHLNNIIISYIERYTKETFPISDYDEGNLISRRTRDLTKYDLIKSSVITRNSKGFGPLYLNIGDVKRCVSVYHESRGKFGEYLYVYIDSQIEVKLWTILGSTRQHIIREVEESKFPLGILELPIGVVQVNNFGHYIRPRIEKSLNLHRNRAYLGKKIVICIESVIITRNNGISVKYGFVSGEFE